jgi:hypothetical protein
MKQWIMQRSTWLGIGAAVIAVLGILVDKGVVSSMWISIASAVLSAFGLGVNDRGTVKKKSTMNGVVLSLALAVVALGSVGCGSSFMNMTDEEKVQAVINTGCDGATIAGCFDSPGQCIDAISDAVGDRKITPDLVNVIFGLSTCEEIHDAIDRIHENCQKK